LEIVTYRGEHTLFDLLDKEALSGKMISTCLKTGSKSDNTTRLRRGFFFAFNYLSCL